MCDIMNLQKAKRKIPKMDSITTKQYGIEKQIISISEFYFVYTCKKGRSMNMNADINFDYRTAVRTAERSSQKEEICDMNDMNDMKEMELISEKCNCSGFSLSAIGGAILMFAGIVIYTLIAG